MMQRDRAVWLLTLAVGAALAPGGVAAQPGGGRERPNVLFLFTDDQRADTIAALGNSHIRTPNLDSLARRGFVFRNAYCLGANMGAVCTPSRNMLLSGRTFFRWQGPQAPADRPNFPDSMRAAGYETYHHGKRGNTALQIQARFEHNRYLVNDQAERNSGEPGKEIVEPALEFICKRDRSRPFCMYLAFGNPHDPRVAAPRYREEYRRRVPPLPRNFLPLHPFDNGEMTVRDERLAPWPRTEAEIREQLGDYYAVITALDEQIGRLLQALRETGQLDRTIVAFSSDHGLALGSHGLMGKQSLYEHSMKAPLIFAGPGVRRGSSEALVYLLDIFPTLVDLVGGTPAAGLDGRSLKGVIEGKETNVRETLGLAYRDVQRSVRDARWKLIRYPQVDVTQLFDLRQDPHETKDLAADPRHAPRIARLTAELRRWQEQVGDTAPLTVPQPKPRAFVPPL